MKPNQQSFGAVLFKKADLYFAKKRHTKYATSFSLAKGAFFLLLYFVAYYLFVFRANSFGLAMSLAVLLGLSHVLIPVNISHDAIHGSLSRFNWVNKLGRVCMELTGANSYMYGKKHLEAHFNKENGKLVNNISLQGLLLQKKEKAFTINLPYVFYIFYSQYMIFARDFFLFKQNPEPIANREYLKLLLGKLLYAICFLVLPFVFIPLPWWQILSALLLMYFIITVLLVVLLLMPTEKMVTNKINDHLETNNQWLVEILKHNVDFSPGSRFLNYLVGGANLNVVHYIFPGTNHIHYNSLAAIIQETSEEFGLLYRKQEVKDVLGIHFNYLKNIHHNTPDIPANVS